MNDMNLFVTISTVTSGLGITLGTMIPAIAMAKAIGRAVDALARQPESAKTITRSLFIGLAMIESLAIYCLVIMLIILFGNPLVGYLASGRQ